MTIVVVALWKGGTPPATIAQEIADALLGKHPELWGFIVPTVPPSAVAVPSTPSASSADQTIFWRVTKPVWNIRDKPYMEAIDPTVQVIGQLHAGDIIQQLDLTADSWVRHAAGWSHTNGLTRVDTAIT